MGSHRIDIYVWVVEAASSRKVHVKFDAMGSASEMFQIFGQGFVKEIVGKMVTSRTL